MDAGLLDLATYQISPTYGFLIDTPLTTLPEYFSDWVKLAKNIPTLFEAKLLRKKIHELPLLDHTNLQCYREVCLAFTCLSFISNAYFWQEGDEGVPKVLPCQLAVPLHALAEYLGTKPIVTYISFVLSNWRLIDPDGPLHYKNMDSIVNFPGGDSSKYFGLLHVQVELQAAPGINACVDGLNAAARNDKKTVHEALITIKKSLVNMKEAMALLHKEVDPTTFYNTVRPLFVGWGGPQSVLPEGLIYEGVSGESIHSKGGSAAHSATLNTFDAVLGVIHSPDKQDIVKESLHCLPSSHREFVYAVKRAASLNEFVESCKDAVLTTAYNDAVTALANFRTSHISIAVRFIIGPSKNKDRNKTYLSVAKQGTAGSDPLPFLKNIRDTTKANLILSSSDNNTSKEDVILSSSDITTK